MTLFTIVLVSIIILAIIGLGWNTFVVAVLDGFDRTLDVSIPIIKNLTQEAHAQTNNNMTIYENKTLGIAFDYPTGWEVSDWDFSDEAEEELIVQPVLNNSYDRSDPEQSEAFSADLKTELTIKILDNPETLNPNTFQMESVSVQDFCTDLRASLSDETLETAGFSDPYTYWLTNEIGKDEITTVANQPACRIDSIELRDDVQGQFDINVYFQKDDKAYSLTFSADPTNVPTLAPIYQKMIDSFRFI